MICDCQGIRKKKTIAIGRVPFSELDKKKGDKKSLEGEKGRPSSQK